MELTKSYGRTIRGDFFQTLKSAHGLMAADITPANADKCRNAIKQTWETHQGFNRDVPEFKEFFLSLFAKEIKAYGGPK